MQSIGIDVGKRQHIAAVGHEFAAVLRLSADRSSFGGLARGSSAAARSLGASGGLARRSPHQVRLHNSMG
jgi:hypothetical protein